MLNTMSMTLLNRNVFNSTYYLQKNCGLDLYTTPLIDKIGKKSRDAERALALVANSETYATFDEINLGTNYTIETMFDFQNVSTQTLLGNSTDTNMWLIVDSTTQLRHAIGSGISVTLISDISFENKNVKIVREDTNVKLMVDDILKDTQTLSSNASFIIDRLFVIGSSSYKFNNNLSLLEIDYIPQS